MTSHATSRAFAVWGGMLAGAAALGLGLVLLAGQPAIGSDQGVFLSVAARMLDGDALYSDVVDNKDPLFFYTYAAALWIGGWRGPSLLDGLWFAIAALSFAGVLRELRAPRSAVATGFVVYPLALAGGWYFTGLSMLGALAVAPASAWLWLRGRYASAGAVAVVAMLFKLNLALVVLAMLGVLLAFDRAPVSRARQAGAAALGIAGTTVVAALVLAVQGSLRPYLETIAYNAHYASARVEPGSPVTQARAHLSVVSHYVRSPGPWAAPAVVAALVAFAIVGAVALRRGDRALRLLVLLGGGTLGASMVSLALTAYADHHLQLLALPAALIAAAGVTAASAWLGARAAVVAAAACVLLALWSTGRDHWPPGVSQWTVAPVSVGARELERARVRFYASRDEVRYVVFGNNGEDGHAAFIDDSFDLACRWFHLYWFSTDEQFEETIDCFDREKPELVLVSFGFDADRRGIAYPAFVRRVRQRLADRYTPVSRTSSGFEVWRIRDEAES